MKTLILLPFVWLCSGLLLGQDEILMPFTNYANCTHGLKTQSGKVIRKAEFEVLQEARFRSTKYEKPFWLVQRGTEWGVLAPSGKILVPIVYKSVMMGYDLELFAAFSDSGAVVYNSAGTVMCRIPGCVRLHINKAGLITTDSKGKSGFLSCDFNTVLPMQYDRVTVPEVERWEEGREEILSERYLLITEDSAQGMYDRRTSRMVVPPGYKWVSPHWVTKCAQSSAVFLCENGSHEKTVWINAEGRQVPGITEMYSEINCIPLDSCGEESVQTLIIRDTNGLRVVNLLNGEKSQLYEDLCAFGGRTVFKDGDDWGVLDTNLTEMKRNHRYAPALQQYLDPKYQLWERKVDGNYLAGRPETYKLHWEDEVIYIIRSGRKKEEPEKRNDEEERYLKTGLFHYRTGAVVPPKYGFIRIVSAGGKNVYWAFKDVTDLGEMGTFYKSIDIYDHELKFVRNVRYLMDQSYGISFPGRDYTNRLKVVFQPEEELLGAVDAYGKVVIPIAYTIYKPLEKYDRETGGRIPEFYAFGSEKDLGLYTVSGELIIPHRYEDIGLLENDYLLAKTTDGKYDIRDKKGQVLLEGCGNPVKSIALDESGNCLSQPGYGNRFVEVYYVRKGNRVYVLSEKGLQLVDAGTFNFDGNYLMIVYNWVLNKQGELVDYRGSRKISRGECSQVIDNLEDPPVVQEPVRNNYVKPQSQKPVRACTWKATTPVNSSKRMWQLYDRRGYLRYAYMFDYPVTASGGTSGIVHADGKFGVLDTAFNFLIPLQYDYIYPCDGYLLYSDSVWRWYSRTTGTISEAFDAISLERFGKERLVFRKGQIGIINDSLRMVVPLMDSAAFARNVHLVKRYKFAEKYGKNNTDNTYGVVIGGMPESAFARINTGILIEYSRRNSTANATLKMDPVDRALMQESVRAVQFYFHVNETHRVHVPHVCSNGVFSMEIIEYNRSAYDDQYRGYRDFGVHKTRELANYLIVGSELKPLKLKDILKTDAASQALLDGLLLKRLNDLQAFGNNCTDIQERISVMKQHFLISGYSIRFYYPGMYGLEIDLHYSQLKTIMKDPAKWRTMTGG